MSAQPARPYLGIGEVLAKLRGEFPDISVSKIRFLESAGLIAPARAPSGYRKFGVDDVERLRYILTVQRDQYLPLRVIKERLPDPAGPVPAPPVPATPDNGIRPPGPVLAGGQAAQDVPRPGLTRRELLDAAGITDDQLAELEDFGLVRRDGRRYGPDALEVTRTVVALAAYGVQARHLRGVRAAAERETTLIEQVVAPTLRQRSPSARATAGAVAREIADLSVRLHRALIEAALAEAGLPAPPVNNAVTSAGTSQNAADGPAAGGRQAAAGGRPGRRYGGASA
ncbi:MAG TPA: MerR family transcriptional regulator [Streptosporangiaceae bacterium]|jgi:DNA-binding transcriptional MerR regulator|nr:MerR family transcriptional regulator [Streptosporangiaceae bacterium]